MNRKVQLLISLLAFAGSVVGGSLKTAKDLNSLNSTGLVDVIVQFKHVPTEVHHRKVTDRGGHLKTELGLIKAGHYSIPAGEVRDLAEDPEVTYISPDRPVKASLDYANSTVGAGLAFQAGFSGSGVGVAVIDSGINDVWDLKLGTSNSVSRIVYSQSFLTTTKQTSDAFGHGTHVAGILAGNGNYSGGLANSTRIFRGMAPQANLINLRVLDQNGNGTDSGVIAAIQQAISLKSKYNIRVINLSLGRPVFESYTQDPLCQAVEQAWKAGIVVVVAAGNQGRDNSYGNSGYATIAAPGDDPYVITVGAMKTMGTLTRADDLIASYSSKGPTLLDHIVKPDIVAPGNRIISLLASKSLLQSQSSVNLIPYSYYQNTKSASTSGDYYRLSGTSMAAPMVSGAAALLIQQNPSLTADQVKARLMRTATKGFPAYSVATDPVTGISYTSQYDMFTVGAGYLDAWAALNNTDLAPSTVGSALSPTARYDPATGNVYVNNTAVAGGWDANAIWSISVVWGPSVSVDSTRKNVVWGSKINAVWGSSGTQGFNTVWGSTAVWGSSNNDATESTSQLINGEN
ncbi:MAG TPA: S8 family peptidase [Bryobacteraceae bacterium]|nr:S8 family peptidase [Bryobacteraceae bacterium]